jgi:pyruvate,water dikinase
MDYIKVWEGKGWGVLGGEDTIKAIVHGLKWIIGRPHDNEFYLFTNGHVTTYVSRKTLKEEAEHGLMFYNDETRVNALIAEEKVQLKKRALYVEQFEKDDLSKMNYKQLANRIDEATMLFMESYGLFYATQPQFLEKFVEELQQQLKKNGVQEYSDFLTLTTPTRPSIIVKEEIAIRELLIKMLQKEHSEKDLQEYLHEYRFVYALEGSEPKTKEDILKEFEKNTKNLNELKKEVEGKKRVYEELRKKQIRIIREHNIPKELIRKIALLQYIGNARLQLRHVWATETVIQIAYSIEAIKRRFAPDTTNYTNKEFDAFITHGKLVSEETLKERTKLSLIGIFNGKKIFLVGKEVEDFLEKNLEKEIITNEVSGMVACKGVVEGIARVITPQMDIMKEIIEMKKGEVLVANQTRPFMMPAIYKASAIVTDEGGITSHAAIVSREFNLPCIVGTQNSTRTFKTGDRILVDANKGIAKKLK